MTGEDRCQFSISFLEQLFPSSMHESCSSYESDSALKGTGQSCSRIAGYLTMQKSNRQGQPKCVQILIIQTQNVGISYLSTKRI